MSQPHAVPRRSRLAWAQPDHPVFRLEFQRLDRRRVLSFLQFSFNPLILAAVGLTTLAIVTTYVASLSSSGLDGLIELTLGWTIGILLPVQIVAGAFANVLVIAQTSPIVSGEMELQSWRLLRTTTLSLREIIFAKLYAALINLRLLLVGLLTLRIVTTVSAMLLVAYFYLRQALSYMDAAHMRQFIVEFQWAPVLIPAAMSCLVFMTQPPLQFLLNGVIGTLASVYSRSRAQAVALALIVRLALWVFTVLVHVAAIYALVYLIALNWAQPSSAPIAAFRGLPRPDEMTIAWAVSVTSTVYMLTIITAPVGIILAGLGIILRKARRLGV